MQLASSNLMTPPPLQDLQLHGGFRAFADSTPLSVHSLELCTTQPLGELPGCCGDFP